MTKSARIAPNQFAAGLDISATRMQADLVALANRLNVPLPADIARRWVETHMVAGFLPNTYGVPANAEPIPQALPWMGAYNSLASTSAPAPAAADIANPWRAKSTSQVGIQPSQTEGGDILSWECAWSQTEPCLLDSVQITLATDDFHVNPFLWGADGAHGGGVAGNPVNNITLQVLVDSALATENRAASLMPVLLRSFTAAQFWITQPTAPMNTTADTMQPPPSATTVVPAGICLRVFPRQPIPENARVRLILSLPQYSSNVGDWPYVDWFGYHPWQKQVMSSHVTILCPAVSQ